MAYQLIDNFETVQVFGPQLASQGQLATIQSFPSGSVLIRTVPQESFDLDQGQGILSSLSTAVEDAISGGLATAAVGTQGIDDANLLFDAVVFTVVYVPPSPVPGTISTEVTVPVDVVAADTQFGSFLTGGSLQDRLAAARDKLAAMATG
jgi:hypothetical protein